MSDQTLTSLIIDHAAHPGFLRATASGTTTTEHGKMTIRRILLRGRPVLQVTRYVGTQAFVQNVDSLGDLDPCLDLTGYRHLVVQSEEFKLEARVTKRGAVLTSRTQGTQVAALDHDRPKERLIPESAPFLEVLGLASGRRVKPTAQRKYRQIDQFVRALVSAPGARDLFNDRPVSVADYGCGKAYLTFATYYYLREVLGLRCTVLGIDRNVELVDHSNLRAKQLGWSDLIFRSGSIADVQQDSAPDVVVGLHACDTATDDVILRAVEWESPLLLVSPCCHHDLQKQIESPNGPEPYKSLLRHGFLKERFVDVLTDSLRCDLLRLVGYDAEVLEFVSVEQTARNLLIRAGRLDRAIQLDDVQRYIALRDQWQVEPHLERRLTASNSKAGDGLRMQLARS